MNIHDTFFPLLFQSLPASTGLLEATVTALPSWRKQFYQHPVLTWRKFADRVRQLINILCSLEHLHQLAYQLQLAGEVRTACLVRIY